jgi:hypothetical protein
MIKNGGITTKINFLMKIVIIMMEKVRQIVTIAAVEIIMIITIVTQGLLDIN